MTMEERIKRINELYHKSQSEGLSEDEKNEQKKLRKEYIESVRGSLKSQLDNIDIKEADGSITHLSEKKKEKDQLKKNTPVQIGREEALKYRRSLSYRSVEQKSTAICNKVLNSPFFEAKNTIFLYCDYNKEVKTKEIFIRAAALNKKLAYPKCDLKDGDLNLDFYYITGYDQLSLGYNGILEPDIYNNDLTKVTEFDGVIIVPGVVFDKECNRTGYGKGFYDRFLKDKDKLYKVGICYDGQITDKIAAKDTDIPMDAVITETSIYKR